jgi:hypothetical protein
MNCLTVIERRQQVDPFLIPTFTVIPVPTDYLIFVHVRLDDYRIIKYQTRILGFMGSNQWLYLMP